MTMPTPDRDLGVEGAPPELEAFLRDLAELSMRTGFWIAGCGECGSPWVEQAGQDGVVVELLTPTDDRDGYSISLDDNPWGDKVVVRATRPATEAEKKP